MADMFPSKRPEKDRLADIAKARQAQIDKGGQLGRIVGSLVGQGDLGENVVKSVGGDTKSMAKVGEKAVGAAYGKFFDDEDEE